MGFASVEGQRCGAGGGRAARGVVAWFVTAMLTAVSSGCGVAEPFPEELEGQELGAREQAVEADNGLSLNGLSLNGLSLNGLSLNGLSLNGLATEDFSNWFNGNATGHDSLMRYMVRCAVRAGETRTFQNPVTGLTHVWEGGMGLAPDWAGGAPASVQEQQVISACLAAHANNYGLHVSISLLGRDAKGAPVPFTSEELSLYVQKESCFFGNVFANQGLFAGNDRSSLAEDQSTSRPCGMTSFGALSNENCTEVKRIGQCESYCTLDASGTYYTECTYGGVRYQPLNTRIQVQDVHRCGDGVCQKGEKCGWGITAKDCLLDCGTCAG